MGIEILTTILEELSKQEVFPASALNPNRHGTCAIPLPDGGLLQIELDAKEENLLIITILGTVTAGRYRENLFREALKANGLPHPRHGTLAFGTQTEHLILFESMPLPVTGGMVGSFLPAFVEKASIWREAVGTGSVPQVAPVQTGVGLGGLLGLR